MDDDDDDGRGCCHFRRQKTETGFGFDFAVFASQDLSGVQKAAWLE